MNMVNILGFQVLADQVIGIGPLIRQDGMSNSVPWISLSFDLLLRGWSYKIGTGQLFDPPFGPEKRADILRSFRMQFQEFYDKFPEWMGEVAMASRETAIVAPFGDRPGDGGKGA